MKNLNQIKKEIDELTRQSNRLKSNLKNPMPFDEGKESDFKKELNEVEDKLILNRSALRLLELFTQSYFETELSKLERKYKQFEDRFNHLAETEYRNLPGKILMEKKNSLKIAFGLMHYQDQKELLNYILS